MSIACIDTGWTRWFMVLCKSEWPMGEVLRKEGICTIINSFFPPFLVQRNENSFIFHMTERIQKTDPFKISLFKHDCIPQPELAPSTTWIQLGVIIFFLIIFGLFSGLLTQLKILVSTSFYPDTEMKRIHYLHAKLLKKRAKLQEKTGKNVFARTVSHQP